LRIRNRRSPLGALRSVSVSEPEGFAKPPSHGREVVRSHSAEHPMDQALLADTRFEILTVLG